MSGFKDVRFRLSFDLLGLKYDYVTGYSSSSTAQLAVRRNEADYRDETLPFYRAAIEPQMVKTVNHFPLLHRFGFVRRRNYFTPDVPELLPFTHYYQQVFGKMPSGIDYDALKAANIDTNMTRLIMLPPNSPAEAIATLRQAITPFPKIPTSMPMP